MTDRLIEALYVVAFLIGLGSLVVILALLLELLDLIRAAT